VIPIVIPPPLAPRRLYFLPWRQLIRTHIRTVFEIERGLLPEQPLFEAAAEGEQGERQREVSSYHGADGAESAHVHAAEAEAEAESLPYPSPR
jgi:hypothetical protein